jgi:hypothetical protein
MQNNKFCRKKISFKFKCVVSEPKKKGKGKRKHTIDHSYLASNYYVAMVTGLGFLKSAVKRDGG